MLNMDKFSLYSVIIATRRT